MTPMDHIQKRTISSLSQRLSIGKISSKSVQNFVGCPARIQTDEQTNVTLKAQPLLRWESKATEGCVFIPLRV